MQILDYGKPDAPPQSRQPIVVGLVLCLFYVLNIAALLLGISFGEPLTTAMVAVAMFPTMTVLDALGQPAPAIFGLPLALINALIWGLCGAGMWKLILYFKHLSKRSL